MASPVPSPRHPIDPENYTLTVVIPCYNERSTIHDIVGRVRNAPVANKEIIIVDDCSTDGTRELLRDKIAAVVDS